MTRDRNETSKSDPTDTLMDKEGYLVACAAIETDVASIHVELGDLGQQYRDTFNAIAAGRAAYNDALGHGDETGMSAALASIREGNERQEDLKANALKGFSQRITKLRERHQSLRDQFISTIRREAETALKAAQAKKQDADLCEGRCSGVLSRLNTLTNALDDSPIGRQESGNAQGSGTIAVSNG